MSKPRILHVIHFNDIYNIEASNKEPVGGAAKFIHQVKSLQHLNPLVLFGGDCYNPSLMSTVTCGKQMVPILNAAGVKAAVLGNHDLDFGLDNFEELAQQCNFPWLLANVLDSDTGKPLAQAGSSLIIEWEGVKVGVMGLAEGDWVDTLAAVEPEEVTYLDFVEEGRRLARKLREDGADLVFALTHMRVPHDMQLAREVPEIDVVLGGHDHHYEVTMVEPHYNLMVKSGTDFRDMTLLTIEVPPSDEKETLAEARETAAAVAAEAPEGLDAVKAAVSNGMALVSGRATVKWQHIQITGDIPDDEEIAKVVEEFAQVMGGKMDEVVGATLVDLDGRFTTVRTQESNLGNLICDVFRQACHADVVILNSGTFRSDVIHPAGALTCRDLVSILPMMDDTVVIQATGEQLLGALENGVSHYPALEGRFPQVSGISFSFDPSKPKSQRVVTDSVKVGEQLLQPDAHYRLATKAYLAEGKDGYNVLEPCPVLQDSETCPLLPTVLRRFFMVLDVLNALNPNAVEAPHKYYGMAKHWHRKIAQGLADKNGAGTQEKQQKKKVPDSPVPCKNPGKGGPLEGACVKHPDLGTYVVAPVVDGRITSLASS